MKDVALSTGTEPKLLRVTRVGRAVGTSPASPNLSPVGIAPGEEDEGRMKGKMPVPPPPSPRRARLSPFGGSRLSRGEIGICFLLIGLR